MITVRETREQLESTFLSEHAVMSSASVGRERAEDACSVRTAFQRDVDRITYCKAFRRMMHKTQVFLNPEGDHYRTRLTHTLEVTRIARSLARALRLNEDLSEAIALGHDLGHTPFGHAGERALSEVMKDSGGFRHNAQSLRVVSKIENDGHGLNLTFEVRDGIVCHTGAKKADTFEGRLVHLADRVAYVNHDVDDAIRAGVLSKHDIPLQVLQILGTTYSKRIDTLITDIINESDRVKDAAMSKKIAGTFADFRTFMFENVYNNPKAKGEEPKVQGVISGIFEYYVSQPDKLPHDYLLIAETEGVPRAVCDYVSGMTDNYAIAQYEELFMPLSWQVK